MSCNHSFADKLRTGTTIKRVVCPKCGKVIEKGRQLGGGAFGTPRILITTKHGKEFKMKLVT